MTVTGRVVGERRYPCTDSHALAAPEAHTVATPAGPRRCRRSRLRNGSSPSRPVRSVWDVRRILNEILLRRINQPGDTDSITPTMKDLM
jgi:hypothetical protein